MDKHVPIELNEENVLTIYNNCLAKENNSKNSDLLPTRIFTKESCGKDSPEIIFKKSKIEEYSSSIEYLYGQLLSVHHSLPYLQPSNGFIDYTVKHWTKENSTLMAFYYLGVANITIMPFILDKKTKQLSTDLFGILPTLSPNDPNFRKKDGQEPADD